SRYALRAGRAAEHALGSRIVQPLLQCRPCTCAAVSDDGEAFVEVYPPCTRRVADVDERLLRGAEEVCVARSQCTLCVIIRGGQNEQVRAIGRPRRDTGRGRFLEDDVCVRAAEAE